jgi:hypothetical protein
MSRHPSFVKYRQGVGGMIPMSFQPLYYLLRNLCRSFTDVSCTDCSVSQTCRVPRFRYTTDTRCVEDVRHRKLSTSHAILYFDAFADELCGETVSPPLSCSTRLVHPRYVKNVNSMEACYAALYMPTHLRIGFTIKQRSIGRFPSPTGGRNQWTLPHAARHLR